MMTSLILATVSPSEDLPDLLLQIEFSLFILGSVLAIVLVVASFVIRGRAAWFYPALTAALFAASIALAISAYVYKIDYVAIERDGTKASPPIWHVLIVPSLPILVSLFALTVHRRKITPKH